jgi:hypothetical protein
VARNVLTGREPASASIGATADSPGAVLVVATPVDFVRDRRPRHGQDAPAILDEPDNSRPE